MDDLISIIIAAYNAEETLRGCLDSILLQTYARFEVLIIDDGSTDTTSEIAKEYTANDNRFTYYHKENGGQSSARNLGLLKMCGDLFTYVDSDDEIMPEMLEMLYKCLKTNDAEISMCGMVRKTGNNEKIMYCHDDCIIIGQNNIVKEFLTEKFVFGPFCKLFSLKFKNIQFTEGIIYEDIEILSRIFLNCNKVAICNYPGYLYYVRKNSTTNSVFNDKKLELLKVTQLIENRIIDSGISCEKELTLFVLNSYLSILLMISDSKKQKEYRQVYNFLIDWIRKNKIKINKNNSIPSRKKTYAKIFALNNKIMTNSLAIIRKLFR